MYITNSCFRDRFPSRIGGLVCPFPQHRSSARIPLCVVSSRGVGSGPGGAQLGFCLGVFPGARDKRGRPLLFFPLLCAHFFCRNKNQKVRRKPGKIKIKRGEGLRRGDHVWGSLSRAPELLPGLCALASAAAAAPRQTPGSTAGTGRPGPPGGRARHPFRPVPSRSAARRRGGRRSARQPPCLWVPGLRDPALLHRRPRRASLSSSGWTPAFASALLNEKRALVCGPDRSSPSQPSSGAGSRGACSRRAAGQARPGWCILLPRNQPSS